MFYLFGSPLVNVIFLVTMINLQYINHKIAPIPPHTAHTSAYLFLSALFFTARNQQRHLHGVRLVLRLLRSGWRWPIGGQYQLAAGGRVSEVLRVMSSPRPVALAGLVLGVALCHAGK